MVNVVTWSFLTMVVGEKLLVIVGLLSVLIVMDCWAGPVLDTVPVLSVPVTVPAGMVLMGAVPCAAGLRDVTCTTMSQLPLESAATGTVPPVRLMVPLPTVAVSVPVGTKLLPLPSVQT